MGLSEGVGDIQNHSIGNHGTHCSSPHATSDAVRGGLFESAGLAGGWTARVERDPCLSIAGADHQLIVVARADDTTFGILHSRFHEIWSLRLCTWLGKGNDPRYTPSTTFETFPFPSGLTPSVPASGHVSDPRAKAVALEPRRLVELRDRRLNPPGWVEVGRRAGSPAIRKRPVPRRRDAAKALKNREPLPRPPAVVR